MSHDEQPERSRLQRQLHQAVDELLAVKQELARQERTATLLPRIAPELAHRIGRSLFDQLLATEADRAAAEATRQFPAYLEEVTRRVPPAAPR
jgi:transposase